VIVSVPVRSWTKIISYSHRKARKENQDVRREVLCVLCDFAVREDTQRNADALEKAGSVLYA